MFTNSNAAVSKGSVLGSQLNLYLHAGEVGASKPSPVPFLAIVQRSGVNPSRILYVGDSYHHDVVGASRGGMKTAYLKRKDVSDRTYDEMFSEYGILPDIVLDSLNPSEIEVKINALIK